MSDGKLLNDALTRLQVLLGHPGGDTVGMLNAACEEIEARRSEKNPKPGFIEEKRGWRVCTVHKRRTKQTHCYWCLKKEVEELRLVIGSRVCGFCGWAVGNDDPDWQEKLTGHLLTCEKHPLAKATAEMDKLRAEIEAMREVVRELWVYGTLHPVTGVVYPSGSHAEALERANHMLMGHARRLAAVREGRC